MDTSNSLINVPVRDWRNSVHPEEQELAVQADTILREVFSRMKPILRYVCVSQQLYQSDTRCVRVCEIPESGMHRCALYLNEDGYLFGTVHPAGQSHPNVISIEGNKIGDKSWEHIPFMDLLRFLKELLVRAEEKRLENLRSITERREMLDRVLQVVQVASTSG